MRREAARSGQRGPGRLARYVRAGHTPGAAKQKHSAKPEHLVIWVGRQLEGCTYELEPHTRRWLAQKFPRVTPARSVSVAFDTKVQAERMFGPLSDQMVLVLTGLDRAQVDELGGYVIVDPVSDKLLSDHTTHRAQAVS